ncbi:hypothetical protein [Methanimicrococcus hacksteinii]|uniref:hypothetical protein n=1 Tax=Methanimicrococcus hacksteinii TaxID=3028293 RepID=UPI00298F05E4|nr:hypothetical protein [Methanimicrococcus sp. At1]
MAAAPRSRQRTAALRSRCNMECSRPCRQQRERETERKETVREEIEKEETERRNIKRKNKGNQVNEKNKKGRMKREFVWLLFTRFSVFMIQKI